jgi:hypothetical protein
MTIEIHGCPAGDSCWWLLVDGKRWEHWGNRSREMIERFVAARKGRKDSEK